MNILFDCSFVSSLLHIILIFASFVSETRILAEMKIENCGKIYFPLEKINKHTNDTFSPYENEDDRSVNAN